VKPSDERLAAVLLILAGPRERNPAADT